MHTQLWHLEVETSFLKGLRFQTLGNIQQSWHFRIRQDAGQAHPDAGGCTSRLPSAAAVCPPRASSQRPLPLLFLIHTTSAGGGGQIDTKRKMPSLYVREGRGTAHSKLNLPDTLGF